MIITGISEAIGNTPLLALETTSCELSIKLEYLNPCGSMKDRMALSMLEDLIANPRFSSDDTHHFWRQFCPISPVGNWDASRSRGRPRDRL